MVKNKIKDLYCRPTIAKGCFSLSSDGSFGHLFAQKWWLLIFYLGFFLSFLIIYLNVKWFLTDFRFFFFFFFLRKFSLSLSLSLSPVLIQNGSYISVKQARLNKIVFTSFSFVFWALFRIRNSRRCPYKWFCSVYGTPAVWQLMRLGYFMYVQLFLSTFKFHSSLQ